MEKEDALTIGEVGKVAERALEYQQYVFRKTYGVYYLIWAAAMVLLGATNLGAPFGLRGVVAEGANLAVSLTILAAAGGATARIFRDAHRTLQLRRALAGEHRSYGPYFGAWLAAVYAVVLAVDVFYPGSSQIVVYALVLPVPFLLYHLLGMAFPDGRPTEGLIASGTYGGTAVLSLALSIFGVDLWITGYVWAATAAIWSLAAVYALFHASDGLEALRV